MLKLPGILLLIDSLRDSDRNILCGIKDYALENNIQLIKKTHIKNNVNKLIGILRYDTKYKELDNLKIPTIAYPQYQPDPKYINIIDKSEDISQITFNYLKSRNLGKFAFCGFGSHIYWSRERAAHFLRFCQENGYEAFSYDVFNGMNNEKSQMNFEKTGYEAARIFHQMAQGERCKNL